MNKETKQYIYVGKLSKRHAIQLPISLIRESVLPSEIQKYVEIIHNKEDNQLIITYRKVV